MNQTLKSKNIPLRHIKLSDAEFIFECEQDDEARKNFMSTPKNVAQVKKELKEIINGMGKKRPHQESFAIEFDGQLVGHIWIDGMDSKYEGHRAEIGYMIHKNFRGKGIGTKAIKLVTDYAFKKYKLVRMATVTRDFNIGSRKALEKSGYKLEGIMIKNKCKNGVYFNDCLYARVK